MLDIHSLYRVSAEGDGPRRICLKPYKLYGRFHDKHLISFMVFRTTGILPQPFPQLDFRRAVATGYIGNGNGGRYMPGLRIFNYCMGFVDLLGQRAAMRGQGLLPEFRSSEERLAYARAVQASVGAIMRLQERAQTLVARVWPTSPVREKLAPSGQAKWDEMLRSGMVSQRWSDGLALFCCVGDDTLKCHANSIFEIFATCGSLSILGLSAHEPIRGAIEVAWGCELRPQELYGPVVARAYELESNVAQYPRIVVGENVTGLLRAIVNREGEGDHDSLQYDRDLAEKCLQMIGRDVDGSLILHYLGNGFREAVTQDQHVGLYSDAKAFAVEQLELHRKVGDTKLAFRYANLLRYFEAHPAS